MQSNVERQIFVGSETDRSNEECTRIVSVFNDAFKNKRRRHVDTEVFVLIR